MTVETNGLLTAPRTQLANVAGGGSRPASATARLSRLDGHWFAGKLHPFQRTAVKFLLEHPNAVLADDVGLGKTVSVLSYIAHLEEAGLLTRSGTSQCRVLWLTSPGLVDQTRAEIERFLPTHSVVTSNCRLFRRASTKVAKEWRARFGDIGPDILLLGYQAATESIGGLVSTTAAGLVVLDDANQATGIAGVRYNAINRLVERAPRIVSVTATPMWNDPMDLYRLLRLTGVPGLWPEGVFRQRFVKWRTPNLAVGRGRRVADTWLPGKAEEVRGLLATCMVQRSATEAKVPTPRRTGEHVRLVPLTPSQMQAYEEARHDGGEAVVRMGAAGRLAGYESPLIDALVDELGARAGRQVIVFSETPAVLDLAEEALGGLGSSYVRADGDMKQADRNEALAEFRQGRVRILLGSDVLTRGLNLGNCNELLTLDPTWTASEEYQREGRMRALDSPHQTYRHVALVPDHPLNKSKLHTLDRKWATANAVRLGRQERRPAWASIYAD